MNLAVFNLLKRQANSCHIFTLMTNGQSMSILMKIRKEDKKRKKLKFTSKSTNITEEDQNMLWDLPHSATDHNPGKLALCIDMPVMIRHNDATELCITKGQESTVAAWQSHEGPYGKQILDTLFVKLTNPPNPVKFDGLLLNVVLIVKRAMATTCRLR